MAIEYIVKHGIAGDIVECGVWRGGSMMAAVLTLQRLGVTRDIHLFDTYEGMSEPTGIDRSVWGKSAGELMRDNPDKSTARVWAYSTIDEVKKNLSSTGYPARHFHYHKGRVEDTIPGQSPVLISLLRLDTDWYDSTRHELLHLYPCLAPGGVLIVDDYGHWEGARKAVDEYIDGNNLKILLNRIDYTGRIAIKP